MGLGNGNPNYGNKGSNYAFELANLKLLKQIVVATGGTPAPISKNSNLIRVIVAGIASTPIGTSSVSFFNASSATESLVATGRLLPGESVSFSSDGVGTLAGISYDPDPDTVGNADLVISIVQ
tara:strand:- start:546 stop:914 length:369 start_codon:yes stop_codon:yes gene_type:complete